MPKELFLKRWIPEGQHHCVIDPATYKKKRPGYILFPTKCFRPIPDNDAEMLLDQNPNLIGTTPMKGKSIPKGTDKSLEAKNTDFGTRQNAAIPETVPAKSLVNDAEFVIDEEVVSALQEIAAIPEDDFNKLKRDPIIAFGKRLGITISTGIKNPEKLAILNKRCADLTAEAEAAGFDLSEIQETNKADYGEDVDGDE